MKHLAALVLAFSLPVHAQDSPAYLNDGSAIFPEARIRTDWDSKPPKVLWKTDLGKGCTSFAVAGDRAIVGGNDGKKDTFWCLDAKSGRKLWTYTYDEKLQPKYYDGGPNTTPTIDGDRVYLLSKTGLLHCVNLKSGQLIWKKHYKDDFGGKAPQWGFSAAPLVHGDLLLTLPCSNKGSLYALDKKTGEVRWQSKDKSRAGYAAPRVINFKGTTAALVFHGRNLVIYDIDSQPGRVMFTHQWRTSYDVNASNPQYHNGLIFIASGYGMGYTVLDVSGPKSKVLHKDEDTRMIFQNSILTEGDIVGVFGDKTIKSELIRMDMRSGKIHWRKGLPGTRGSSLLIGDHLVALCETGHLIVGTVDRSEFKELGRSKILNDKCWAPVAYANGRIFARTNKGSAVCLDVSP